MPAPWPLARPLPYPMAQAGGPPSQRVFVFVLACATLYQAAFAAPPADAEPAPEAMPAPRPFARPLPYPMPRPLVKNLIQNGAGAALEQELDDLWDAYETKLDDIINRNSDL